MPLVPGNAVASHLPIRYMRPHLFTGIHPHSRQGAIVHHHSQPVFPNRKELIGDNAKCILHFFQLCQIPAPEHFSAFRTAADHLSVFVKRQQPAILRQVQIHNRHRLADLADRIGAVCILLFKGPRRLMQHRFCRSIIRPVLFRGGQCAQRKPHRLQHILLLQSFPGIGRKQLGFPQQHRIVGFLQLPVFILQLAVFQQQHAHKQKHHRPCRRQKHCPLPGTALFIPLHQGVIGTAQHGRIQLLDLLFQLFHRRRAVAAPGIDGQGFHVPHFPGFGVHHMGHFRREHVLRFPLHQHHKHIFPVMMLQKILHLTRHPLAFPGCFGAYHHQIPGTVQRLADAVRQVAADGQFFLIPKYQPQMLLSVFAKRFGNHIFFNQTVHCLGYRRILRSVTITDKRNVGSFFHGASSVYPSPARRANRLFVFSPANHTIFSPVSQGTSLGRLSLQTQKAPAERRKKHDRKQASEHPLLRQVLPPSETGNGALRPGKRADRPHPHGLLRRPCR